MSAAIAHVPRWSSGAYCPRVLPVPQTETQFDSLVYKLGLENRPDLWQYSDKLKKFAKAHRNKRYVPEFLLDQWGLEVYVDRLGD
jgi:hypothetical protein